jgi:hypothetical protein
VCIVSLGLTIGDKEMNRTVTRQANAMKKPNPLLMALFGVLIFIGSFPVLFLNETQENLASVTKEAVQYTEDLENNTLAYTTGSIQADDPANDLFIDASFLTITRTVEMYGYQETQTTTNGEDRYTYTKAWVIGAKPTNDWLGSVGERPLDIPEDYDTWAINAPPRQTAISQGLSIDGVPIDAEFLYYSGYKAYVPSEDLVADNRYAVQGDYLYYSVEGSGSLNQPVVGDLRLSFSVIDLSDEGLLIGQLIEGQWNQYLTENNNTLYRFFAGETSIESVISILQAEYELMIWIIRFIGFLMMFIGLLLAFKPLMSLFRFVPFFGDLGNVLLTILLFLISLVLSSVTILLSLIVQNILLVVGVVILLIALFVVFAKKRKINTPVHE